MRRLFTTPIRLVIALVVALLIALLGVRWFHHNDIQQQVMTVLQNDNRATRLTTIARLRDAHRSETLHAIVTALDDPDEKIRDRAGNALSVFYNAVGEVADTLVAHLTSSPSATVRIGCAIMLMTVKTPRVRQAYLQALNDPSDRVVEIACTEIAARAGAGAADALFPALEHPSWRVRLEACKALITLKAADRRVVATLETMSRDPEAARYDAESEEFDRQDQEMGSPPELRARWGKIETILDQARRIASSN